READDEAYRPRRVVERPCGMRRDWQRRGAGDETQKMAARKRHRLSHRLRNQLGAESSELLIGDRPRLFETIKLLNFVGNAEADQTPHLLTRLLRLQAASLRHPPRLSDHVREYCEIGEHDQGYHPQRLAPPGYVVTPEQVSDHDDEEVEP